MRECFRIRNFFKGFGRMNFDDGMALSVWECALPRLQAKSEAVYSQYFACMQALEVADGVLHLGVPDDFFRDMVLDNYSDLLSEALRDIDGIDYSYELHEGYPVQKSVAVQPRIENVQAPAAKPVAKSFGLSADWGLVRKFA